MGSLSRAHSCKVQLLAYYSTFLNVTTGVRRHKVLRNVCGQYSNEFSIVHLGHGFWKQHGPFYCYFRDRTLLCDRCAPCLPLQTVLWIASLGSTGLPCYFWYSFWFLGWFFDTWMYSISLWSTSEALLHFPLNSFLVDI